MTLIEWWINKLKTIAYCFITSLKWPQHSWIVKKCYLQFMNHEVPGLIPQRLNKNITTYFLNLPSLTLWLSRQQVKEKASIKTNCTRHKFLIALHIIIIIKCPSSRLAWAEQFKSNCAMSALAWFYGWVPFLTLTIL